MKKLKEIQNKWQNMVTWRNMVLCLKDVKGLDFTQTPNVRQCPQCTESMTPSKTKTLQNIRLYTN